MRQPEPTKGNQKADPQAMIWFKEMFAEATARGLESYPGPLETFNGRDADADGMEELIDAWKYWSQARMERAEIKRYVTMLRDTVNATDRLGIRTLVGALCEMLGVDDD